MILDFCICLFFAGGGGLRAFFPLDSPFVHIGSSCSKYLWKSVFVPVCVDRLLASYMDSWRRCKALSTESRRDEESWQRNLAPKHGNLTLARKSGQNSLVWRITCNERMKDWRAKFCSFPNGFTLLYHIHLLLCVELEKKKNSSNAVHYYHISWVFHVYLFTAVQIASQELTYFCSEVRRNLLLPQIIFPFLLWDEMW